MKKSTVTTIIAIGLILSMGQFAAAEVSKEELESISTPDKVNTSLGELKCFDGVPTDDTVKKVYDNLDRMRGVQVFLDTLGGASMYRSEADYHRFLSELTRSAGQYRCAVHAHVLMTNHIHLLGTPPHPEG